MRSIEKFEIAYLRIFKTVISYIFLSFFPDPIKHVICTMEKNEKCFTIFFCSQILNVS